MFWVQAANTSSYPEGSSGLNIRRVGLRRGKLWKFT
jgi:hypothetical protein